MNNFEKCKIMQWQCDVEAPQRGIDYQVRSRIHEFSDMHTAFTEYSIILENRSRTKILDIHSSHILDVNYGIGYVLMTDDCK